MLVISPRLGEGVISVLPMAAGCEEAGREGERLSCGVSVRSVGLRGAEMGRRSAVRSEALARNPSAAHIFGRRTMWNGATPRLPERPQTAAELPTPYSWEAKA